ncbi:MAG: ABC transporter permease [Clostridia bacterium]|nr:ABC transporter permease [Clostridia bacterium]
MIFQFVKTNILSKKLRNFLAIFSIAISVILIIAVENITEQLNSNIIKNASYYDVIVGAPGSETQLILNTIFYYDNPIANIDISYYEDLQKNIKVQSVVPVGMGDNYSGYRIIGTSTAFFEDTDNYHFAQGAAFIEEGDAVLGSTVAKVTGLKIGDTFVSTHGLTEAGESDHDHGDFHYKVVGILEQTKTPNDTVIFTDIKNLWEVHGLHHDEEEHDADVETEHIDVPEAEVTEDRMEESVESSAVTAEKPAITSHGKSSESYSEEDSTKLITALLVRSKGLSEQYLLMNELGKDSNIQAVNPTATLRKLLNTLDIGSVIVRIVAYIAVILSIIMLFTTMLSSSLEKMKDISILRALGANRKTVFQIILLEAIIIAVTGAVLGFVVAHIAIGILGNYTAATYGLDANMFYVASGEWIAVLVTIILSLIAGMIPGMMVYRADATKYIK